MNYLGHDFCRKMILGWGCEADLSIVFEEEISDISVLRLLRGGQSAALEIKILGENCLFGAEVSRP